MVVEYSVVLIIELVEVDGDTETDVCSVEVARLELVTEVVEVGEEVSVTVVTVVTIACTHSRPLTLSFCFLLHLTLSII